jgi:hypothetical protein
MSTFEDRYRTWHTWISYVKSGVRIVAGIVTLVLLGSSITAAVAVLAAGLILAELLGIAEELV